MTKYNFSYVEYEYFYENLIKKSPQNNIFVTHNYLNTLKKAPTYLVCKKSNEIVAGMMYCVSDDGKKIFSPDFIIYSGIFIHENFSKKLNTVFEITDALCDYISNKYKKISITMHPSIEDIRPFLWFNYHNNDGEKYHIHTRYTLYIPLDNDIDFVNGNYYYDNLNSLRRRNIKQSIKNNYMVKEIHNYNYFINNFRNFYKNTFLRQNINIDEQEINFLEKFIQYNFNDEKFSFYGLFDGEEILNIAIISHYNNVSKYLYSCSSNTGYKKNSISLLIWEILKDSKLKGSKVFDFEGINSPNRSYFKMSFGGYIKNYYKIELNNK